ncbi:chloride channel protein [Qipengyuania aestuarii]|uniref:chloride channel protein n=1 Tax=Qipengyuania aestuarii TaxID=2867241 RepID=UPI001FFCBD64|nr:chloride channel protein [Qipengyuania aestuarii]
MALLPRRPRFLDGKMPQELVSADDWKRRIAMLVSAVLIGLAALLFAELGDHAQALFSSVRSEHVWLPLVLTPATFLIVAALTRRFASEAGGSGIPQVMAASRDPMGPAARALMSLRAACAKIVLTVVALCGGASVGREGPTVQLAGSIMVQVHRLFRLRVTPGVIIAGGAAGVAAAFNTPLAGIAFAIEELATAYEQRVAVLVMGAVMIAGLTAQGLAGDYIYFGLLQGSLPLTTVLIAAPLAGLFGGVLGGLFSRLFLMLRGPEGRWSAVLGKRPLLTAALCGVVVGLLVFLTDGDAAGTGYEPTRALLEGEQGDYWFGPAKFLAALATSVSGIPGGIFAPSLAAGAGFGQILTPLFPAEQAGLIVLLGMAGYFTGVVRAPLTAVIILGEATGSSHVILPLFATALIGDWAGSLVCREKLYLALARGFMPKDPAEPARES